MTPIESIDLGVTAPELRREMLRKQHPADCWFCAAVVVCDTEILTVRYFPDREQDRSFVKFPGGCGEGDGNTPARTLLEEIRQEILGPTGKIVDWTPFWKKAIPCKRHAGGMHTKYAAFVDIKGPLRSEHLYEGRHVTENGDQTNEMLLPPEFIEAGELVTTLFPGHKSILLAAARAKLAGGGVWWEVAHDLANVQEID